MTSAQLIRSFVTNPPAHLVVSTIIDDKDWDTLFGINWRCFGSTPEIAALSPEGLEPAKRAANVEGFKRGVFGGPIERAYAKISESQSDQIVSYISSRVYRGPKGIIDDPCAEEPPKIQLPFIRDVHDRAFCEWYWNSLRDMMHGLDELQVPHIYIQSLATDPGLQHQGAASMLMEWAISFATEAKIGRCALHASQMAGSIGFFEKFGFRVVSKHTFIDEKRFPGREGTPLVTMVKDV